MRIGMRKNWTRRMSFEIELQTTHLPFSEMGMAVFVGSEVGTAVKVEAGRCIFDLDDDDPVRLCGLVAAVLPCQ